MSIDREELQAEREFLLRSLDDLDAELLAGNIDPDNYRVLHDDYTARASAVIKTLDDGVDRERTVEQRGALLRYFTIGGTIVFCVLVALLVAHTSGQRRSGDTTTSRNNQQPAGVDPNSYLGHMQAATTKANAKDFAGAIEEYTAAANLDPTQAGPLAQRGSLTAQVAAVAPDSRSRTELLGRAISDLDAAIKLDPTYALSYAVKGAILERLENKPAAAIPVLTEFLVRASGTDPNRANVQKLLAEAQGKVAKQTKP